jgi:autotransporter-associated beta strand protein
VIAPTNATVSEAAATTVVYNGTITDTGGASVLVKTGPGTLQLNGTDTYTGGTKILEGALEEDGNLALGSGPVYVAPGAELSVAV